MPKLAPCLWFDNEAEEAAKFYVSVFPGSRITGMSHYTDAGPGEPGAVLIVEVELNGRPFQLLNGGRAFTFNEAVSFVVDCKTQAEVDTYSEKLTGGGGALVQCGWVRDRFGVSWQIVPDALIELMKNPDKAKVKRMTQAMFAMKKLDIAALERAFHGDAT